MLSDIARVFSSQGVVLQGTSYTRSGAGAAEKPASAHDEASRFAPVFDQASVKLELSEKAKKELAPLAGGEGRLSEEEKKLVEELEKRDREVRAHEQAHMAGGNSKGGANYEYQVGPDGKNYAVGGNVAIDVSPVKGDPEATLRKAQSVQHAALAPADPSGQDQMVAAAAMQMAAQASRELAEKASGSKEAEDALKPAGEFQGPAAGEGARRAGSRGAKPGEAKSGEGRGSDDINSLLNAAWRRNSYVSRAESRGRTVDAMA